MTKPRHFIFLSMVSFFLASNSAFPWGDVGHQIVGDIAEKTMNQSTKNFVRGIIGIEPLAVAAAWPDHVRDDRVRFSHSENDPALRAADNHDFTAYHFCEVPNGFTYATRPRRVAKDCYGAIMNAIELLKSRTAVRESKMIALRYLAHVIGDIHQPLHVGNGFDRGGNACEIQWVKRAGDAPVRQSLHTFWDSTIVEYVGTSYANPRQEIRAARYYSDYVVNLRRRYPEMFLAQAKQRYGSTAVVQWLDEGKDLRENGVYPDDPDSMRGVTRGEEYRNRPYCLWYADQTRDRDPAPGSRIASTPLLTREYADRFLPVVEMQLLKGGVRLAWTLDRIAELASGSRIVDDVLEERILRTVQDAFRRPVNPL